MDEETEPEEVEEGQPDRNNPAPVDVHPDNVEAHEQRIAEGHPDPDNPAPVDTRTGDEPDEEEIVEEETPTEEWEPTGGDNVIP